MPLLKDNERDVLRRTILELVKKGHLHYTDIEKKKACATCPSFTTLAESECQIGCPSS